jgi:NADPH:quinone reductase-like Zn-dependent oxidoreductase
LQAGETLLVHGGSGGIGSMALQLAREWGVEVYATARTPDKCRFCEALGATAILYPEEDFVDIINARTDRRGVDVILDSMGGDYLQRNLECLAIEGRLLLIGVQSGAKTAINLLPLLLKRQSLIGSTLRARTLPDKARIARALREQVWPLLETGRIRPMLDRVYPLDEAALAHQRMERSEHLGKMVLRVGNGEW